MTRDSRARCASWILACVVPQRDVEVTIGDLEEEHLLRSRSTRRPAVSRWYWSQIGRSIPLLLWTSVRRGGWVALGVAVGACLVQAIVELATKSAMSSVFAPDARVPAILTLVVGLPTLVFISYAASRIRPGAAVMFAGLIVIAVVVQLIVKTNQALPLWNQIVALSVGPSAAFAGGVLFLRTRT